MPELIGQTPVEVFLNPSGKFTPMHRSLMKERFPTLDGFQLCPTCGSNSDQSSASCGPRLWEKVFLVVSQA